MVLRGEAKADAELCPGRRRYGARARQARDRDEQVRSPWEGTMSAHGAGGIPRVPESSKSQHRDSGSETKPRQDSFIGISA